MDTLASAIARRTRAGSPIGTDQSLTLAEALFAHTIDAAYALFLEDRLGSLEAGKAADVVVVEGDVSAMSADELRSAEVRTTFLEGSRVYEAAGG
jgi:predicted amidohydrolase YtcJ